jgi:hypothetical protein
MSPENQPDRSGGEHIPGKTTSVKLPLWIGIVLIALIIVLVLFIPCPTESQYFLFRIIIAISAAGLTAVIPGVLNINLSNGVTAGGSLAIFALIYFFDPASSLGKSKCDVETFVLTVFVHGKQGLEDKILRRQGNVCLYLNSKPEKVPIDDDGKAVFTEISPTFLNKKIRITIEHPQPYQSTHPDSLYLLQKDEAIYLETSLMGDDKIWGEVLDFKTRKMLDSVRVSILDLESYTNINGWFELYIPEDKQAKFQRVTFSKAGYQREVFDSVPVHTKQIFSVEMKKVGE